MSILRVFKRGLKRLVLPSCPKSQGDPPEWMESSSKCIARFSSADGGKGMSCMLTGTQVGRRIGVAQSLKMI
jgi:hypothetical protein